MSNDDGGNIIRPTNSKWRTTGTRDTTGDGGGPPVTGERLALLEGKVEGLRDSMDSIRHGQNVLLGVMGIGFAIMIGVLGYVISRIDSLPSEFDRTVQTLSGAITATKQQVPQVLLVPAPPATAVTPAPPLPPSTGQGTQR